MTGMAETPVPKWGGRLGDKGVCWREIQRPGAIAPDYLVPSLQVLHRTASRVKLNRTIVVSGKLANRNKILNNMWRHKDIIKTKGGRLCSRASGSDREQSAITDNNG